MLFILFNYAIRANKIDVYSYLGNNQIIILTNIGI